MEYKYDFHIHTALSPCADNDMTPNNIVNMAKLNNLDFIAITDHNTCKNVRAVIKAAEGKDIIVIPGIEVETSEACHIICLFQNIEEAEKTETEVLKNLPQIRNKEEIYGKQLILDENDTVKEEFEVLLLNSINISVFNLFELTLKNGGISIPAHVDRSSYSIISNLGEIPIELNTRLIEVSREFDKRKAVKNYTEYNILKSSDAHSLGQIGLNNEFIELKGKSIPDLFEHFYKIFKQK